MKVIAIIPAFNEEQQITAVICSIKPHVDEIIVIDDGSHDKTAQKAKMAGAIVARHIINRGQGAGLQTGMDIALARGADIIVHFDADGQHPPHQIIDLLSPIHQGEADIVLGSRFLDQTSNVPAFRKGVLKAGLVFTKMMTGLRITDPHSGFRAIHKSVAQKIKLEQDRMAHASEFLQLVARNNLRYKEIPVTIIYTDYSMKKGQSSWNAFKIVIDLIKGSIL